MEVKLKKRARKYLDSVDTKTRRKLYKALDKLSRLEGDFKRLEGYNNRYRYKIDHYRIIFDRVKNNADITVIEINTRTNIKY